MKTKYYILLTIILIISSCNNKLKYPCDYTEAFLVNARAQNELIQKNNHEISSTWNNIDQNLLEILRDEDAELKFEIHEIAVQFLDDGVIDQHEDPMIVIERDIYNCKGGEELKDLMNMIMEFNNKEIGL